MTDRPRKPRNKSGATAPARPSRAGDDDVKATVDILYNAAGDVALLPQAISRVADCLRAHRAILLVRPGIVASQPTFVQAHELNADVLALMAEEHLWEKDLWSRSADRLRLNAGQIVVDEELVDTTTMRKSEIYADFQEPLEMSWMLAGIVDKTAEDVVHMSVFGSDRRGPFDADDRKVMAALLPAIKVAVRSALQLRRFQMRANALEDVLDRVPEAVFLVNAEGRVLDTNAAAEALLSAQHDLTVSQCRLAPRCAKQTRALSAMLHAVGTPGMAPEPVVIRDQLGQPTLLLTAVALRPAGAVRREAPRADLAFAAVFATPAQPLGAAPAPLLSTAYGLTGAEARLAVMLAEGLPLSEIADLLGITRETARSQLKAIFRKTDTNRQSELVALVLSLGLAPLS